VTAPPERPAPAAGALHGRRKGKRLRAGQEDLLQTLLPRLRLPAAGPIDPAALFPEAEAVALEIGFGGGEHLAAMARGHPRHGFIGCEPFVNGLAKMLRVVDAEGLSNVRLWDGDAAALLPRLAPASLDRVVLLYPDPWPKRRQRKRRLVSDATLAALARVVKPGGAFRFATDIDDYAGWTLARVLRSPAWRWTAERASDWRKPWPGWPGTRYEAKALREGRTPIYLTFRRAREPGAAGSGEAEEPRTRT
jgi:tRNA (guanine-N7-)-methyltransferase